MALTPGARLGPYEITGTLGVGGMGEVYRATDTNLKRAVAIKVLPDSVATDRDRLARFQREAEVLASLNHPNIAAIHGLERSGGITALVMELVEGPTLADRISQGAIPVDEALPIARQIAEALEAAHEQGIIHRDLKPANIKVRPDGTVKVLDFGLAKALQPVSGRVDATTSPTITSPAMMTGVGMLLGTAAYMSPEQARGKPVDKRTDIWAFGCVLYEMLAGRPPFGGETVSETLADVIKSEPPWDALPSDLAPRVATVVRRSLEKDPGRRVRDIGDVRLALDGGFDTPTATDKTHAPPAGRVAKWRRAIPFAATALFAAAIAVAVAWNARPAPVSPITRFSIVLPDEQQLTRPGRHNIAVSPDGQNIVYVANNRLYLRTLGDIEARPIEGTDQGVNTPVFSPDGRWVAFFSADQQALNKIAITGGASVTIAAVVNPFGVTWAVDNQILIGQGTQGIARVSGNGGTPETIIQVAPDEIAHGPQMLPDGEHVLFTLAKGTGARWDQAQIVVQSLRTDDRTVLIDGGSDARYIPTGHIVYALGTSLVAVPFDERALTITGGPIPILEGVGRPDPASTAATYFSFAQSGMLAYFVSNGDGQTERRLATADRKGVFAAVRVPPQPYADPRVSPDGKQLVVSVASDTEANIWIYDLAGALAPRRLTFGGANFSPAWMPDGDGIVFISNREDNFNAIYRQPADGSRSAERLTDPKAVQPTQLRASPDAKHVVFRDARGNGDIWILPLEGDRKPQPVIAGPGNQNDASFSPDGRWLLYASNESGRNQIYAQPFPPTGAKYQITVGGSANDPLWSPDGRQIFYVEVQVSGLFRLMSVDITRTESGFTSGNPTPLLEGISVAPGVWPYDVLPDAKFLVFRRDADSIAAKPEIRVTLNWFEELKRLVPSN